MLLGAMQANQHDKITNKDGITWRQIAGGVTCLLTALILLAHFVGSELALSDLDTHAVRWLRTDGQRRMLAPADADSSRPKIVMVFLTTSGLKTQAIWNQWFEDARDFMIRAKWIGEDQTSETPYLSAVMTWHPDFEDLVMDSEYPAWLTVDERPTNGTWGQLLGVVHRGFELALETYPDGTYFILSSDTTIPVKAYQQIVAEIMVDPRSRLDIFCYDFWFRFFKHSQWIMLTREHAQILVDDDDWTHPPVRWVKGSNPTCGGVAATDEYYPGKTLLLHDAVEDMYTRPSVDEHLWNGWTFIYWGARNQTPPEFFGKVDRVRTGHPATFRRFTSSFLRFLVQKQGLWFLRKTTDDAVVLDCSKPLKDYYDELMNMLVPQPSTQGDNCLLKDFLPLLWKGDRRAHLHIKAKRSTTLTDMEEQGIEQGILIDDIGNLRSAPQRGNLEESRWEFAAKDFR
eukprot:Blabericola_migrator_1__1815@NODE_1492_length_4427_cov_71_271789_g979_i0_p2_GENE_NODE_1492_length_4427_cov_71_271789_g979_i0NODE_1492_length_4427_cov_71_271789_g979_i0_p2_ORF_typecomplete_len457_score65_29Branch/PF02485_21/1_8e12_NODE_1492_length_4427_cov_71_271789_g979_i023883758